MRLNPIAIFILLCGAMTLAIANYAWRRQITNGARQFALFMFPMAVYILAYSMELASPDLKAMLFWSKVQYFGILTFPTLFLVFCFQYTGRENWLTRRNFVLLFLLPAALFAVKLFDDKLHLIYTSAQVDSGGPIPLLSFTRGPLYWVVAIYNLLIVTLGNLLLWQKRRFASSLYRQQTTIMLAAAAIIYLVYLVYLVGIEPLPSLEHLDWNPFIYTLWGVAISFAIFRYRLFDLAPVARDALIEMLDDGVVVLDGQSRVVDANPQAQKIFGWTRPPVGESAEKVMDHWIDPAALQGTDSATKKEVALTRQGAAVYYEVTISPFMGQQGRRMGSLIVVHDISQRKEIEKELHELSLVDELTGLTNRRGFKMLATQLISMSNRMELNAVLFYLDLDRLKWINDQLGHATGDQALIDMGNILKNTFRSSDIIARFGGDEFVILAIESSENSGENLIRRLQAQLDAYNAAPVRSFQLSFSIGLTRYECNHPRSLDTLLQDADQAMYAHKQARV